MKLDKAKGKKDKKKARANAVTDTAIDVYLANLRLGKPIYIASQLAGFGRFWTYRKKKRDPEFSVREQAAIRDGTDVLEEAARSRAVDGWEEPVYQAGKLVGHTRKYDSRLLEMLLISRNPDKFGKRRTEVSGPNGAPVKVEDVSDMEVARRIAFVLQSAIRQKKEDSE